MPHSKTGRPINVGDDVVSVQRYHPDYPAQMYAGKIVQITESESCNAYFIPPGAPLICVTLKDCVHVDDLTDWKDPDAK